MGAWGTSLYANDSAEDVRFEYRDMLRRGKTNEEIVEAMVKDQGECINDPEDAPLFWFALADTQWNYGRLMPEVKEKALYYLAQEGDLACWAEVSAKKLEAWKATRRKLEEKLNTPQPPMKKVSPYRLFKCKWEIGDTFAYRVNGENGEDKYMVFRKVGECTQWPGNIVPVIEVFNWIGDSIPSVEEIKAMEFLPIGLYPSMFEYNPQAIPEYRVRIDMDSAREIKKERLTFIAHLSEEEHAYSSSYQSSPNYPPAVFWSSMETKLPKIYFAWQKYWETHDKK